MKKTRFLIIAILIIASIASIIWFLLPRQTEAHSEFIFDSEFYFIDGSGKTYSFDPYKNNLKKVSLINFYFKDNSSKKYGQYDSNYLYKDNDDLHYIASFDEYELYNTEYDTLGDIYILDTDNNELSLLSSNVLAYNAISDGEWLFTSIPEEGGHFYCYKIVKDNENYPISLELIYDDIKY